MLRKAINHSSGFFRSYPCITTIFAIFASMIFQIKILMFYGIYNIFINYVGKILKDTSKYLYTKVFKIKSLPLLGIGERPIGAKYCGCYIYEDNLEGIPTSYGMPSGHALSAVMTSVFWSLYIIDNYPDNHKKLLALLVLNSLGGMVCLSRIYLGCHTIQHVIVGGLFGILFGFLGYKLYLKLKF